MWHVSGTRCAISDGLLTASFAVSPFFYRVMSRSRSLSSPPPQLVDPLPAPATHALDLSAAQQWVFGSLVATPLPSRPCTALQSFVLHALPPPAPATISLAVDSQRDDSATTSLSSPLLPSTRAIPLPRWALHPVAQSQLLLCSIRIELHPARLAGAIEVPPALPRGALAAAGRGWVSGVALVVLLDDATNRARAHAFRASLAPPGKTAGSGGSAGGGGGGGGGGGNSATSEHTPRQRLGSEPPDCEVAESLLWVPRTASGADLCELAGRALGLGGPLNPTVHRIFYVPCFGVDAREKEVRGEGLHAFTACRYRARFTRAAGMLRLHSVYWPG